MEWLVRKLGRPIEAEHVRAILESLEFGVRQPKPGLFYVSVPSWRATKDITIKDDLLEEIGRVVGYDTVPPVAPLQPVERPWVNRERLFHHDLRQMCAAQGYTETSNYSFISDEMALRFGMKPEEHLRVGNPISVEQALMRRSLLPGMHRNIVDNMRHYDSFRLFEIGNEINPRSGGDLPDETPHLMAVVYAKDDGAAGLGELRRLAACLMPGCEAWPVEARAYEHPARAAEIGWRGKTPGRIYELHPEHVETGRAAILDIDLKQLLELGPLPKKYTPLRRYPTSAFDVSVVAGLRDLTGRIGALIREAGGAGCLLVEYLYSYKGKPLADDQQSLSYRVTVGADDRTLTNVEVQAVRDRIIASLAAAGYSLR
jgi:phenylalanyl-tRNA synthetase beta chain